MGLLSPATTDDRPPSRRKRRGDAKVKAPAVELVVPHEWHRELYDTMRTLGGDCGTSCTDHPGHL